MSIRLNKLLASRGIAARRACDVLISEGRVRVNGRVVSEAGTTVDEGHDRIEVDGKLVPGRQKIVYYVLNKPVGVITTLDDPQGRPSVRHLLPKGARVYPVGRLDADTSGLLLLTNDGDLAHKLMHPSYGVTKTYRVRLASEPTHAQLSRLERGVEFERGVISAPARARRIDPGFDAIMIEMQIHEGRFRQVRRMCEKVGLEVTGLHRVGYGPLRLGPMAKGVFRELSESEVTRLQAATSLPMRRGAGPSRPARPARAAGGGPAKPEAARREARPAVPEDDGEIEDTWVPGGGFSSEFEDDDAASVWPLRPEGRRGDADFTGAPAPKPAPDRTRPARSERPSPTARGERPARFTRRERPAPAQRGERPARSGRSDRPAASPRGERPARFSRSERAAPAARTQRGGSFVRSGRPARGERGDRPAPFARFARPKRTTREDRRSGMARGERPASPARDSRPRRFEPSEAPSRADRSFRSVGSGGTGGPSGRGKATGGARGPVGRRPSAGPSRGFSPSRPREAGEGRQGSPVRGRPRPASAGRKPGLGGRPSRRPK